MERVTGIGGLFFKSQDPEGLARWYERHLGVTPPPASYDESSWWQAPGPTVFAAMNADSEHFGRPENTWAVTFRVQDLAAMVVQLERAGITVSIDPETYPNGRFAELSDPEGNPIQLWQAAGADLRGP